MVASLEIMLEVFESEKPVYKIKHSIVRKKDVYEIVRPNGSIVNEAKHSERNFAERHLSTLIAFGYCTGEVNG